MARVFRRRAVGARRGAGHGAGGTDRGCGVAAAPPHSGRFAASGAGVVTGAGLGGLSHGSGCADVSGRDQRALQVALWNSVGLG